MPKLIDGKDYRTQAALERRMKEDGRTRAMATIDKALARHEACETPAGVALTKRSIEPLTNAIILWLEGANTGKAGRRNTAATILNGVDPALAAYIAVKYAINSAADNDSLLTGAHDIGRALNSELVAARFEAAQPALYTSIVNAAKERGSGPLRITNSLKLAEKKFGFNFEGWTPGQQYQVGLKLIELLIEALGIVRTEYVLSRRRSAYKLAFGEGMDEWFKKYNGASSATRPLYLPTLIPPKPWEGPMGGSYHLDLIRPVSFIAKMTQAQADALLAADMGPVYAAVNAIQDTPWAVNRFILDTQLAAWELPYAIAGLPRRFDEPLPEMPEEIEALPKGDKRRRAWRRERRDVHMRNVVHQAERSLFQRRLNLAKDFVEYDKFYFPHRCDFRGRIYPACDLLSPQGDDTTKGLLRFAVGKPIGVGDAGRWFAVHGANLFGFDKASLEDRERWAFEHSSEICAGARDPIRHRFWTEADKPWQFLAWCVEWVGYINDPEGFHSHLPIALDGSCNGLQHFAAMLRDSEAGRAVNLVASDKPSDIYATVADAVNERLYGIVQKFDHPDHWKALAWYQFGIDRKITKRPVMVLPYGGTFASCMEYVREAVDEKLAGKPSPFGAEHKKACAWLAGHVWAAISEVIISARAAMSFIQGVARVLAKHNLPMTWTAPDGFPVINAYYDMRQRRVQTRFHGSIIRLSATEPTKKMNASRQALASSPNFVHSLDAAALVGTVNRAKEFGIENFAMVHDSYGTHAADTPMLAAILREVFADQYGDHDVLAELRERAQVALPKEAWADLPELPAVGDLDIEAVIDSPYFFA